MRSWGPPDLLKCSGGESVRPHSLGLGGRLAGCSEVSCRAVALGTRRVWKGHDGDETYGARGTGAWDPEHSSSRLHRWWLCTWVRMEREGESTGEDISRLLQGDPSAWRGSSSWWTGLRGQGTAVDPREHGLGCKKEGQTESEIL